MSPADLEAAIVALCVELARIAYDRAILESKLTLTQTPNPSSHRSTHEGKKP